MINLNFNEEQLSVINEVNRNILLLASAGTGKTNTLSYRISNLIENKICNSNEILCITFTNKACKEMSTRLEQVLGTKSKDITIKTFHSFCYDILKEQAKKKTDIFTDFIIFDEDDCKELLKYCNYYNYPVVKLQQFIREIKLESLKLIDKDYNDNIYKEIILKLFKYNESFINNVCTERGVLNSKMKNFLLEKGDILIRTYNSLLRSNHGVDFDDLVLKVKELFKDDNIVNELRVRYKYINIDEVQDTSTLEYSIIEKLFYNNNILICGDLFQTIYSWRGSMPQKIFEIFKSTYNPLQIVFTKNYRATKSLTAASIEYLNNAFPLICNDIYKDGVESISNEEGNKIIFSINETAREEARFIFDKINSLYKKGENISKSCILTRDNNYNISLSRHLENIIRYEGASFDFILVDQFKFFRRQEIKDIIAFLKLIANQYDNLSLKRILDRLPSGIGDKTLEIINSINYKKIGITLSDFIDPNVYIYGEKYSLLINEFNNNNIIVFDVESTGIDVTEDEIIQIAAIKINKNGEIIERFEKFLRNNKSVKDSVQVHGYSDEFLLKNGEDKKEVLEKFLHFSKDSVVVGHNVQYDINILNSELSRNNLNNVNLKGFYDTLDIYRRFYPNLINHKLETLSKLFETEHKPSHDAMDDIIATSELLVKALNTIIIPSSMERLAYMSNHLNSFKPFYERLANLFIKAKEMRPYEIVAEVINSFNIKSLYIGEEAKLKIERLRDFYVLLKELDDTNKSNIDSLLDIVKITSLSNGELESLIINRTGKVKIPIITIHQAKGLEFNNVFIAGVQQETFPSYLSLKNNDIEEEKRLMYVAITRAKKNLFISYNKSGFNHENKISCLLKYLPSKYVVVDK